MKQIYFLLLLLFSLNSYSQTIGLQYYDTNSYDGYLLLSPERYTSTYLINNCGQVINEWAGTRNGTISYLLENGNLLKSGQGWVELQDWDGNLLWEYDFRGNGYQLHHDIEPLPNGNFLALIRHDVTQAEAIQAGRNPSITSADMELETIIEVNPLIGINNMNIAWQWSVFDHLIQDYDITKDNYGVVTDHPELFNFNYDSASETDWVHANGLDYNADLDQIVFSARSLDEIYIIDHSTTTAEAASHAGGNSGKGGDLLWRWGNPLVYSQGVAGDQKLFGQHDPNWIPNGYPNAGMISVFSNTTGADYSQIEVINPSIDINGDYELSGGEFIPTGDSFWSWNGQALGTNVYSARKGGTYPLPNGNFIISEAQPGRIVEVTSAGSVVWVYENPVVSSGVLNQGDNPTGNGYFKVYKYPNDYIGLNGRDLTPGNLIEDVNTVSDNCITVLDVDDSIFNEVDFSIFPNPVNDVLNINNLDKLPSNQINIYDVTGKVILDRENVSNNTIQLPKNMSKGVYFIKIKDLESGNSINNRFIKQ